MPASSNIERMLDDLIAREGGYVDHPADRGGPTKFGITEQTARSYGYEGSMRDLPLETAKSIYRLRYWTRSGFYMIAERGMPRLAEELFDTGVNMGVSRATRFLQRALNVLNRGAKDYPDIGTDGEFGPMSLNALDRFKAKRGEQAEAVLLSAVDALQGAYYIALAERNSSQEAFVFGWLSKRLRAAA